MTRNPFKTPPLRLQFDQLVRAHRNGHKDLFYADGSHKRGSSLASAFWRGFEGTPQNWDRASKGTFTYAAYRAGAAVRQEQEREHV